MVSDLIEKVSPVRRLERALQVIFRGGGGGEWFRPGGCGGGWGGGGGGVNASDRRDVPADGS